MAKIDLITGFLGSGKTTFLKQYVSFLLNKGERICILEFDYGAINVDMMLLQEFNDRCDMEMVAGGCDYDCHLRRFKTKLIAMGMKKYDRVIVEPSGIFDPDEFFDTLAEEPLDQWYEIGSVISIVDAGINENLSLESKYLLASQLSSSGLVLISKSQLYGEEKVKSAISYIKGISKEFGVTLDEETIMTKPFSDFGESDFERIMKAGYMERPHVKMNVMDSNGYASLYFMDLGLSLSQIKGAKDKLFLDPSFGSIARVKGFVKDNGQWYEINATKNETVATKIALGQDVIIVIGEQMNEKMINSLFSEAKK
ncbi:MAG: GTPase (G3E family) [Bacilli bacterium]|nr:GTPase (G3E family) [Bacilli bacterium]